MGLMGSVKVEKRKERGIRIQIKDNKIRYFDYSLLAAVIFLICFGLVMLYSTSSYSAQEKFGDNMYYFKRQALFSAASLAFMLFVSKIHYHWYANVAKLSYWIAFVLMALVLSPLGISAYGARRWIRLPLGFQMQPSEVMKLAIVIFIPLLICKAGKKIQRPQYYMKVFAWGAAAAAGVFILTDNLSTAIIVLGMVCVMIFVAHPKTWSWIVLAVGGIAGIYFLLRKLGEMLINSGDFRMQRILVWLRPEAYADEGGFQVMQSQYAIGSGGFFGKGLGNSAQKMIIPEVQNDMILSIICEELGVFGAIIVLVLFGFLLYRLMFIAQNAPDMYGALIVTGIFAHIAIQVILNVCVVLNIIPTTGITLPFISYGGTSILFLLTEMGVALGVSRRIKIEE